MLTIKKIDYLNEFPSIQNDWNRIAANHPEASPFLSYQWQRYYSYGGFCTSDKPLILRVVEGNEAVAYLALLAYYTTIRKVRIRTIGFAQNPDTFFNSIVATGRFDEIFACLFAYLTREYKAWDILLFDKIHENSRLNEAVRQATSAFGLRYDCQNANTNLFLPVDKPWEEYYQARTKNFRKSNRGVENRLERNWKVEFRIVTNHEPGFHEVLEKALKISAKSWKAKKDIAISSSEQVARGFKALCENGIADGPIILYVLYLNDIPVAVEYHLRQNDIEYALRADFDEEFGKASPGSYLDYSIIKELFHNGVKRYELGPGLNEYKLNWTESSYKALYYRIFNPTLRPTALWHLENHLIPLAKKARSMFYGTSVES